MLKKPKIVLWDIETSLAVLAAFGLRQDYIAHTNILQDWYIICACWKELDKDKIHAVSLLDDKERFKNDPSDDYHVVTKLRDMLLDVDVLIHHNGDRFDLKKLNARIIFHGLEALPPIKTVDTLKEARKVASFTSAKLDYLAKFFGSKGKTSTSTGLWLDALRGDKRAIKEMVEYNKGDVEELEFVYRRLLPYMKAHPNIADSDTQNCPVCNSTSVQSRGYAKNRAGGLYRRVFCNDCRSWARFRGSQLTPPKSQLVKL